MVAYGPTNHPRYATRDHVVPQREGGKETIRACWECNQDKSHFSLNEWRVALILRHRRPIVFHYEWVALRLLFQLINLEAQKFFAFY